MAFKGKVASTKTVFLHLLLCLIIFYTVYYMTASVCFGAFRLESFDGLIPFDFKTEPSDSNSKYLVNLLSMELTYFFGGLLFAVVVKRWVWDYAITVTFIHVLLTSAVMAEFPLVWQWWLALGATEIAENRRQCECCMTRLREHTGSGLFLMICNGQLLAYFACHDDHSYPSFENY